MKPIAFLLAIMLLAPMASPGSLGMGSLRTEFPEILPQTVPGGGKDALKRLPIEYETPEWWKTEVLKLPPDVIPPQDHFPWTGDLVMQFAPTFVQPDDPGFFTSTYLWWVDEDATADRDRFDTLLHDALLTNERGFVTTYLVSRYPSTDISEMEVVLNRREGDLSKLGHSVWAYDGVIKSYEPFITRGRLDSPIEVHVWYCEVNRHTAIFFKRSPHLQEVRDVLDVQYEQFLCHKHKQDQ